MAQMTPQKHGIGEFNNNTGEEYGTQLSKPQDFTMVVENATYSAEVADSLVNNPIDNSEANNIGDAEVEIIGDGINKTFKFKRIKGASGGVAPISTNDTELQPNSEEGSVGSSDKLVHSDHVHPFSEYIYIGSIKIYEEQTEEGRGLVFEFPEEE